MTTAVVLIRCERTAVEASAQQLADIEGVAEVYSVSGRYDLVAIIRVRTEEEIPDLLTTRMSAVRGIVQTETLVAFRVYSPTTLGRGFALGFEESREQ